MDENGNKNMIRILSDLCMKNGFSMPSYELAKTEDNKYKAICHLNAANRSGVADNKKEARVNAAKALYRFVVKELKMRRESAITSFSADAAVVDEGRTKMFQKYRELKADLKNKTPSSALSVYDRHLYFYYYPLELKKAAFTVLDSENYSSDKAQVLDLFKALKITAETDKMPSLHPSGEQLFISLNVSITACFAGPEDEIYQYILDYFRIMLL